MEAEVGYEEGGGWHRRLGEEQYGDGDDNGMVNGNGMDDGLDNSLWEEERRKQ